MDFQHFNLKIPILHAESLDVEVLNPVFQSWIQQKSTPELLIDVADYVHVPEGPGMVLIGLEADYSIDHGDGRWGLRYNRKAQLPGDNIARMKQVFGATIAAARRLESGPTALQFNAQDWELWINDRALAPNTAKTYEAWEPELKLVLDGLFGKYELQRPSDPRERCGVRISVKEPISLESLGQKLAVTA